MCNSCQTSSSLDYGGFQAGADFSRLNVGGYNIHFGATAGYAESSGFSSTRNSTNSSINPEPIRSNFQVPFVGAYAVVTKDRTFADFQTRWDFFQGNISNSTFGLNNQPLNARAFSFIANVGHQIPITSDWFVEPSAGIIYSRVGVDRLSSFGSYGNIYAQIPGPAKNAAPFTARISDFDSILGRLSLRVGTNIKSGDVLLQPYFTGSVYHEFGDAITTNVVTDIGLATANGGPRFVDGVGTIRSNRIGTYGQVALGLAGQILNTGWQGYVRGDYRIGDHIESFGASAGIRYSFNPEPSAVRTVKSEDGGLFAITSEEVNWTGVTVGGSVGAVWDFTRLAFPTGGSLTQPSDTTTYPYSLSSAPIARPRAAGLIVGGGIGANYQFGKWVVGVEGDASWVNAQGGRACPNRVYYSCKTQIDMLSFVTGRVGYAWGRTLFYGKGGLAIADVADSFQQNNTFGLPLTSLAYKPVGNGSARATVLGWALGAGFEVALTNKWSAKAEYLHYDLEANRAAYNVAGVVSRNERNGDLVRIGLNYRFGSAPVVASAAPIVAKY
ncbi:outer membrane beta-barrel protein [Methylobacterium frigidaeris]|uniref:outer membrane beta-barrel protein n=1 Tax=Methylobacterium frigidaeris TaxID=2038277 RepID=UPI001EDE5813|nr:outer membrane beta-barrel protein [Methylobacterium frigidaeris]